MAFVTGQESRIIAQNIQVTPWQFNTLDFSKIKLPSSFSFAATADEFPDDTPRTGVLNPDDWDFFDPVAVVLFVTSRDFARRTVEVEAIARDDFSGVVNAKLKEYVPDCYFDDGGVLSGDTTHWSVTTDTETRTDGKAIKLPVYHIFGLGVVANSFKLTYIYPTGKSIDLTDATLKWQINASQSLPDKTLGELLYVAAYNGGFMPVLRPAPLRSKYSARWYGLNLCAEPKAVKKPAAGNANTFAAFNMVAVYKLNTLIKSISGQGLRLFVQWDTDEADLSPNGCKGVNMGYVNTNRWGWFCEARTANDGSLWFADSFGQNSYITQELTQTGVYHYTASLHIGRNCAFWSADEVPTIKIYFNTEKKQQQCYNVMCNIGIEPMPYNTDTLDPSEVLTADPFGLDYVSVWDCELNSPTVNNLKLGDEIHQASAGYVRYGSEWTDPLLGYVKEGRSTSEDIYTIPVNGLATTGNLIDGGKVRTGLLLVPRPEPTVNLSMVRRVAMLKNARKVTFTSPSKLNLLKLYPMLSGFVSLSGAKRADAKTYSYEGTYYPSPDYGVYSTQTITFAPWGGTKVASGIGWSPINPPTLKGWAVSATVVPYGSALMSAITVAEPEFMRDFGAYVKKNDPGQTKLVGTAANYSPVFAEEIKNVTKDTSDYVYFTSGGFTNVKALISITGYIELTPNLTAAKIDANQPWLAVTPHVIPFTKGAEITSIVIHVGDKYYFYANNNRAYVIHCGTDTGSVTTGTYGIFRVPAGTYNITITYTLSTGSGVSVLPSSQIIKRVV